MAAISITAANVLASAAAVVRREFTFGATVTAGQAVYLNTSNQWVLADSDAAATGNGILDTMGIALNGGAAGQPASVCIEDTDFTPGGTLTVGSTVYLFTTAGAIAHDVPANPSYPVVLGVAKSTSKMVLRRIATGVIVPA
jgi:hypothetical protein